MTTTVLAYIPSPSQGVWYLFGVVPLRAYALCIIAGIVAALIIGDRRWVARGGEQGVIYDIALWAVPFGLIGGRLYHVMTDWPKYFGADGAGLLAALRIWDGGLGIWGAVALGGVGAWIACRRRDIPLPAFADAIAPGIILAQAIGRLGNYFNQELYGRETDLPWGLTIWERLDPSGVVSPHSLDGVSTGQVYAVVHPTFLYELLWNVLIFALLIWVDRRFKIGHGRLFALYVAGYCVGRFCVELMRSDAATLIAGIRVNTFTSMFVFIGAVIYIMVAPKGREDPATLGGTAADGDPDDRGKELVAVAATSGVVAAATVAGDEDTPSPAFSGGQEVSPGSTDDDDDADDAQDSATTVDEAAEDITEAPADDSDDSDDDAVTTADVPAVALEGTEVAEALNAEVETEAPNEQATDDAADGLGSVDADEVVAAEDDAAVVHEAAIAGVEAAEALAEDAEDVVGEDEVAAAEDTAADDETPVEDATTDTPTDPEAAPDGAEPDDVTSDDETAAVPTDGLGSVDGDEVAAAEDAAVDVHDATVEGADSATAIAEDIAAEPDEDASSEDEATPTNEGDSVEILADDDVAVDAHDAAAEDVAAETETSASDVQPVPTGEPVAPTEQPRRRWWRRD